MKPKSLSQHIKQNNLVFNSLQSLEILKTQISEEDSTIKIAANATIKILTKSVFKSDIGFLTDNDNKDYYFILTDIHDEKLLEILRKPNYKGTQVVCILKLVQGKRRAVSIYLPGTVEEYQKNAETFYKKKDFVEALNVLSFINNAAIDYEPAIALKTLILKDQKIRQVNTITASSIYFEARTELKRGNYIYAKKLFLDLVENPNFKSETALKELAYELQREGKLEEAIQIVNKHKNLIKSSNPNSFLAYFYEIKKDYKTVIFYLEKVDPETSIEQIKKDKRLALAFFNIKNYTASEQHLKKVLEKEPHDLQSQKLLDALGRVKSGGLSDEIEIIFNEAELSSLTGGRSPHIQFALLNCDYSGVPPSVVNEERLYSKETLAILRVLIKEAGKSRPKERATYLLTEAKLMEKVEPDNETGQKFVLSRYCFSNSQNLSNENQHGDVVRFYLLEAYRLSSSFESTSRFLLLYFYSFYYSSIQANKLMSITEGNDDTVTKEIDNALNHIFSNEIKSTFWYGILDLFLTNTEVFSQLLAKFYQNESYKNACIVFLNNYLGQNKIAIGSKENFSTIWNEAVDKRRRERDAFNSKFLALEKCKSTEAFLEAFTPVWKSISSWVSILDKNRINSLNDILMTLEEFNTQAAFEDKERYFNIVASLITTLRIEIESSPTEFSFNILRRLLETIDGLLDIEFRIVVQTSQPVITIRILGESFIDDNNIVIASFIVSNKKGSAPVSWFLIDINESEGIEFRRENNENNQTLKGGDDKTLKLKIQVSHLIREQGAFNLSIMFSYKLRGSEEVMTFNENIAIRLYSESEFDEIPNPYFGSSNSGAVEDERMFYGRNEFITKIKNSILESSSKCLIIYGQKRSGKSSVLFHLKKQLNLSERAFCISFSLGEIVEDLSSQTFFYKILSEIEDSLDAISEMGKIVPKFRAPSLLELKESPSIIFNDFMKKFQKECALTQGWEHKNLILLIDEFTYIYTAIQKGFLSPLFMKTWKSFVEKRFFTSILIGQDIMPKFMMDYQNEFGIADDTRLSYLEPKDAKMLIEQPIWDRKRDRSRYLGKAIDLILDYTSSNPYYIQIFCARLVEYMNSQKAISITEADVYEVAQTFIKGEQSLNLKSFDNLITAGDADIEAFNPQDILKALKEIAYASKNLDSCSRDTIKLGENLMKEQILLDLKNREVISCPQPGFYRIKVRLFKEWLLNN